ncbi:hypothetical protein Bca52824_006403 [Brassica carinata]|uniref:Leucine-rich repeat-containing N-terminal plant-type domain-containing protein n=1 Tax=Brassica carinata TaxID=52824 RepID=A0A8X7WQK1_BRACI|nr:hypothetical protein Bca52824_006403 [Brassica carinata]
MSLMNLVAACLWFLLVSSFTGADEANLNCLRSIKSQVKDPNGYLTSWVFGNQTEGYICTFSGVTCWHDDENKVLSINLAGYGLEGEFPLGINNCTDLSGLDLSRNNFSGVLPSNMTSLVPLVTTLDLSYNQFSGKIPSDLSNITFLNTLMLPHNQFTGQIPPELVLLPRLKRFSVADNQLTGPVPNFSEALKIGMESFINNKGLCGRPLDACVGPDEDMIRSGKLGAAVGAALFAPVGAFLGWFVFNGRKQKRGDLRHMFFVCFLVSFVSFFLLIRRISSQ